MKRRQYSHEPISEHELAEKLRKQYIESPPEGMTPYDIKYMSDSDLLDMDYFYMNLMTTTILKKKIFIFSNIVYFPCPFF